MRSIDNDFYRSVEWERCREAYLQKVNHFCERCKAKGIYEPARVVHHKIYLNEENWKDPTIAYGFDNLEALCQDCHNKEHHKSGHDRYEIGSDGSLLF